MTVGFRTEDNSLYWIDQLGCTHRFQRAARGRQGGEMFEPRTCIYLSKQFAADVKSQIRKPNTRIGIVLREDASFIECTDPEIIRAAFKAGQDVSVGIHQALDGHPFMGSDSCKGAPEKGYYPFEQLHRTDYSKPSEFRVGAVITDIFADAALLVREGFPVEYLMRKTSLSTRSKSYKP